MFGYTIAYTLLGQDNPEMEEFYPIVVNLVLLVLFEYCIDLWKGYLTINFKASLF